MSLPRQTERDKVAYLEQYVEDLTEERDRALMRVEALDGQVAHWKLMYAQEADRLDALREVSGDL